VGSNRPRFGCRPMLNDSTRKARAAGARPTIKPALSLLTRPAELAPSWAYPVYEIGGFSRTAPARFRAALGTIERRSNSLLVVLQGRSGRRTRGRLKRRENCFAGFTGRLRDASTHGEGLSNAFLPAQLVRKVSFSRPGLECARRFVEGSSRNVSSYREWLAARPDPHTHAGANGPQVPEDVAARRC